MNKLDRILEDMHFKLGLPIGFAHNGQPHQARSHATGDGCVDKFKQAIEAYIAERERQARIDEWRTLLGKDFELFDGEDKFNDMISVPSFWITDHLAALKSNERVSNE